MNEISMKKLYDESFDITLMIYLLYCNIFKYKLKGKDISAKEEFENLISLLDDCLDKEDIFYLKIKNKLSLNELQELDYFIIEHGGVEKIPVDFEELANASIRLIPRRMQNKVYDLIKSNEANAKIATCGDNGSLLFASSDYEEEIADQLGLNLKEFRKKYLQSVKYENELVNDHIRCFTSNLQKWLDSKYPKNSEQAKFYEKILAGKIMITFTDYTDERSLILNKFNYKKDIILRAPILKDTLILTEEECDIIKKTTTISEVKNLLEDFIVNEQQDVSDKREPIARLQRMYFEAGLQTLTINEFNDIIKTYQNLISDISKDDIRYYSEDGIIIVRDILNKVSIAKFNYNLKMLNLKDSEKGSKKVKKKNRIVLSKISQN